MARTRLAIDLIEAGRTQNPNLAAPKLVQNQICKTVYKNVRRPDGSIERVEAHIEYPGAPIDGEPTTDKWISKLRRRWPEINFSSVDYLVLPTVTAQDDAQYPTPDSFDWDAPVTEAPFDCWDMEWKKRQCKRGPWIPSHAAVIRHGRAARR